MNFGKKSFRSSHSFGMTQREGFSTSLGVIAATLGSAVGLGNIWKFPFLAGENGGAAFILIYLICVLFIGIPVMISEFIIGRKSRSNCIGAFKKLTPGKPWFLTGGFGVVAAFLIMAFYTDVAGWVYFYVFKSVVGSLNNLTPADTEGVFSSLVGSPYTPIFWQWVVLITIGIIIMFGVQKGIERITKTILPALFVLLLICDVRALTLPGAAEGLAFLFKPDFSKITGMVILSAMGLAFFKLSVGMGTMITYGSYMGRDENMPRTAFRVAFADCFVSILAGIAIFPAVFAFGFEPNAGPSLLFITIPLVFQSMPLGNVILILFFVLTAFAATGAMISLLEVPVAFLHEETRMSRTMATWISVAIMGGMGLLATLSTSVLSNNLVLGKTWFDLYDFASSNICLPVGGLLMCIYAGWVIGFRELREEASNGGMLRNDLLLKCYSIVVRFIAPIAIIVVLVNGLGLFQ